MFLQDVGVSPTICLRHATSIVGLATCLDQFTIPPAFYDPLSYDLAQPIGSQREDWKDLTTRLLSVDGNCSITPIPLSLKGIYAVETFQNYCVLYESTSPCGNYLKGWGYMIVPSTQRGISRNVHISAPHPGYDMGTVQQAASIFSLTGSRSLLVAGRDRRAFLDPSDCIQPSSPSQSYYKTDPAHNDVSSFRWRGPMIMLT